MIASWICTLGAVISLVVAWWYPSSGLCAILGWSSALLWAAALVEARGRLKRMYIAGVLPNTPENMLRWLQNPPAVDPLTAMPNLGVTEADARDMAGYLYTHITKQ